MKKFSSTTAWIIVLIVLIITAVSLLGTNKTATSIPFSKFKEEWVKNDIKSFQVKEDNLTVETTLNDNSKVETIVPLERLIQFIGQNEKANVVEEYLTQSNISVWLNLIPTVLLIVILGAYFFVFMRQAQGGGGNKGVMNFGKSRAKMSPPDGGKNKVTFADVAGADEEKAELAEIVDFLKQPKRYVEMGARIPKGILLIGPPGTGKTLLAKAISGEAGVPFFSISGSDFVEMFVGVGASRVRDLFEQAKKNSPCLIFIDEIDAVGRQRGTGIGGGNDEREQTLNQLLVEMDGFGVNEGIIMIAATNRPDILDPALLRPGRFDRQITVGFPDVKGREQIFKVHSKNKPLSDEVKLDVLAKRTPGFTGADIENLMNEAALLAVRNNKKVIGMDELEEAITRVIAGPEKKSRVISEKDKRITAYHEAGHAVVSQFLPNADPVHQVSIIPRGMAAGYTINLPVEDRTHVLKSWLDDQMVVLLGGRVAEKLVFDDISTGAKNDIDKASSIARKMVMEYGMSDALGPIAFGSDHEEVFLGRDLGRNRNFSEVIGAKIDAEVNRFISEAYSKAGSLLTEHRSKLDRVAEALIEKEKLEKEEFFRNI